MKRTSRRVEIRRPIQADILSLAHRMRDADVKEIWDSHRATPYQALLFGMKARGSCWTILGDGIPEGMIGITRMSMLTNRGIAWMLGTDVLVEDKKLFITLTRQLFRDAVEGFDYIENYISTENKISLRWVESMGFNVEDEPIMINGVPFKKFYMNIEGIN